MPLKVIYADGKEDLARDAGEALEIYRHSTSHLMAAAVTSLFPGTHLGIGPAVSDGFNYDFEFSQPITAEDLEKIEKRMRQIVAGSHKFEKKVVSADEARQIFASLPYKLELIEGLEKGGLYEGLILLGLVLSAALAPTTQAELEPEPPSERGVVGGL